MPSILEILNDHGLTIEAVSSGRAIDPDVRSAYDALNNGAKYVLLFTSEASDDLLALLAGSDDCESGEAVVMQSHNGNTVEELRRKVQYRNARNTDKSGKPRAKITLGSCSLSDNIVEGDNAVGFKIGAVK